MTHHNRVRLSKLSLGLIVALAAAPAFAQSTSAGLGGVVTDNSGQPVAGAEVVIRHVESGTVSRATTDASGRYNARGLRVGGPYEVVITKPGEGTATESDVFLNLNQINTVNSTLAGDVTSLDAVTVVGVAGGLDVFSANKMGTGSNVDRATIEALPSIGGNIQDYIRLDPRISQTSKGRGEISAGGQNTRFNSIRVDGVSASDTFGLEANNSPTMRQPVSIDAIQEVNIALADYDTTITGATGAVVNAVTRSGTNSFSGSVYYSYRDKDWVRKDDGDVYGSARGPFTGFIDEETYGMTFGGPLIQDRLFFFANYEKFTRSAPGTTVSSAAAAITNPQMDQVIQIARDVWGMDIGGYEAPDNLKSDLEEYAVKIDWNITDNHRASVRYSKVEQADVFLYGFSGTGRSLSSNWSVTDKTVESITAQLYSDWTNNFSTEFKVSHRDYSAVRNPFSRLPAIGVAFGTPNSTTGAPSSPFLNFGTDSFSHYNVLETETLNAFGAATYYAGDHEIKFGFDYEDNEIYNLFGQNIFGSYTFASTADFAAGRYWQYSSFAPQPGAPLDSIAAVYSQDNLGLFVQDRWAVNYNLTLMAGLRVDRIGLGDTPMENVLVDRVYGLDNTQTLDGAKLWQPRFGFNYTFDSDRPTQVRGGLGLFQGAAANVWVGNSFANTGRNLVAYSTPAFGNLTEAQRAAIRAQFPFSPNPDSQPQPVANQQMAVNLMEEGFKQPSVWKANLAFEHELPWHGLVASVEALYTRVNDGLHYERLDLGAPTGFGPDGRSLYWANRATGAGVRANQNAEIAALRAANQMPAGYENVTGWAPDGVILLKNTDKGSSQQLTVSLTKPLVENWSWLLGYTYTRATEVSPLTSSRAISNWNGRMVFDPNEEVAARSNYELRDRFTGSLTWQKAFFGDYKTTASVFYEGRTGKPYSWGFSNDANGDGYVNDLFYVPSGPGDVMFVGGAAMEAAFFDWLNRNPDLQRYAGNVVPRNGSRSEWVNTFDVRFSQELPGFFSGHKSEIWLDIMNIGNLINKDWGQVYEVGFPLRRNVAQFRGVDPATGRYIYNFVEGGSGNTVGNVDLYDNQDQTKGISRWQLQVGFRYKF
ncbi:TonB-dependent receptor [Luteimonas aestuarii]|uniref:TonB-dependent receptor n=1 Tax=Luteimonas aestuarii TaxID=453837 RepID=A0A4R5U1L3_9GAMM|nr:carboxypeptidase regulatory-like domain-containing protein [Luteimonas aestuarii]TDK27518.1 TonB-dependent receptor [Luteimonas aestuarii]